MYVLGIETTGAFASAALIDDDAVLGYVEGTDRFSHLQNLMPQIESIVRESGVALKDIDVIAVSCGPGIVHGDKDRRIFRESAVTGAGNSVRHSLEP